MWLVLETPPVPLGTKCFWAHQPHPMASTKVLCLRVWPLVSSLPSLGAGKREAQGINSPGKPSATDIQGLVYHLPQLPPILGRIPQRHVPTEAPMCPRDGAGGALPVIINYCQVPAVSYFLCLNQGGLPCTFQQRTVSPSHSRGIQTSRTNWLNFFKKTIRESMHHNEYPVCTTTKTQHSQRNKQDRVVITPN